jgi:UDP-N-acetylglucosamine 2-epimerase (non-hydrolysing)
LSRARLVVTDSGGVIEEAVSLGIPCLIARETTERVEAVELGAAQLVGFDENVIVRQIEATLAQPAPGGGSSIYGDGHAGERIAAFLRDRLASIDPIDQVRRFVEY